MLSPFILLNVITFHIAEHYHLLWNSRPQEVSSDGKHRFSMVTALWGFLATWVCVLLTSLCVWDVGRIHLEIKVTTTVTFSVRLLSSQRNMPHSSRKSRAASLWLAAGEGDTHASHELLEEGDTQVMCCWRRVIHTQVMCCWRRVIHKSCAAGGWWYTSCVLPEDVDTHTSHVLLEKGYTQVMLLEEGDTHAQVMCCSGGWYTRKSCHLLADREGWFTNHAICLLTEKANSQHMSFTCW